jgi:hypothetical protein
MVRWPILLDVRPAALGDRTLDGGLALLSLSE